MPNPCYSLYLTCDRDVLANIDAYIAYAKTTKINAFVVNIMKMPMALLFWSVMLTQAYSPRGRMLPTASPSRVTSFPSKSAAFSMSSAEVTGTGAASTDAASRTGSRKTSRNDSRSFIFLRPF